jgi:lipid II:glycine glycyltransferase (peptidoglycan interpeptide bridge formation enzyme)
VNNNIDKIASHPVQTSFWGEFRKEWGNEVVYTKYGLVTLHKVPFSNLKVAIFEKGPTPTKAMVVYLKELAKEKKIIFIKLEPNSSKIKLGEVQFKKILQLLQKNGAVRGKTLFTPTTFWLNLTLSEEEILKSFKGKTRYNVRLAQKKGVEVVEDNSDKAFDNYLKLTRQTVKRQGFYAHNELYHRLMWKHMRKAGIAHLLVAKHGKDILTTWIIFHWRDYIYYPYGAWSGIKQNLQPNSLMMWEAIKLGKKLGASTFDLWGREEGKGFTKFKEGFNPQVVEFIGSWDLVIDKPAYLLYRFIDTLRWIILRTKSRFAKSSF